MKFAFDFLQSISLFAFTGNVIWIEAGFFFKKIYFKSGCCKFLYIII